MEHSDICGCGEVIHSDEGHDVLGELLCFECFDEVMGEKLFGDPFGEW